MYSEDIVERFMEKVNRLGPIQPHMDTPCWEWIASSGRYGQFNLNGTIVRSHRLAYALARNILLDTIDTLIVRHACDYTLCCNPDHLILGSQKDNVADRVARKRGGDLVGQNNGRAKVTDEDVREIRRLYATKLYTQKALAEKYNLVQTSISQIVTRAKWAHVD